MIRIIALLFVYVIFFTYSSARDLTEEDIQFLGSLRFDDLPRHFQVMIRKKTRAGDNSHWCCKDDLNTNVNFTRVTMTEMKFMKESVKVTAGSQSCGFLGTSKCQTYEVRYVEKPIYYVKTQLVPNHMLCTDRMLVCCAHFTLVAENCMHNDEIKDKEFVNGLLALQNAGLLTVG